MQYKATRKPMSEIATELNIDAAVAGSVQRVGDRVGINVQLIHAPTDRHLWARSYERDLRDVLSLEREIARAISDEIKIKLAPQEQERLARVRPVEPAAYEAYLKGYRHARRFTREDVAKGMDYFRQALALDPDYAPAHAGLAFCYIWGLGDWYVPNKEAIPQGREAARKAIELDPSLAEAHTFLAMAMFLYDLDWSGAEKEFRRAVELNPGSPDAHVWYGAYHGALGHFDAGLEEIRRALQVDPLSVEASHVLGMQLYYSRRYDEAIERLGRTLELDPTYFWAEMVLGHTYEQKGQFRDAIAAFARARQLAERAGEPPPEILAGLARSHALSGNRVEARNVLAELFTLTKRRYVAPHDLATVYSALGENQEALDWLELAYEDRNWWLPWLRVDPRFDAIRSDPRFQAVQRQMSFPE